MLRWWQELPLSGLWRLGVSRKFRGVVLDRAGERGVTRSCIIHCGAGWVVGGWVALCVCMCSVLWCYCTVVLLCCCAAALRFVLCALCVPLAVSFHVFLCVCLCVSAGLCRVVPCGLIARSESTMSDHQCSKVRRACDSHGRSMPCIVPGQNLATSSFLWYTTSLLSASLLYLDVDSVTAVYIVGRQKSILEP